MRRVSPLKRRRETLELPDGDFLDLDFYGPESFPLVILLHGLAGSSRSSYILGLQKALQKSGLSSVAMNFRGCGGRLNRTSRCYHSGETGDLHDLVKHLQQRFPGRAMAGLGFSLGGNVLMKWLGTSGRDAGLVAAVAVSVPMQLDSCAERMDQGFSKVYRNRLLKELKQYVRDKIGHLHSLGKPEEAQQLIALGDLSHISSFWQYDDQVVAKLYGFKSAADYYEKSSAKQYLKQIQIPLLIIHAADDPFMTAEVIPHAHQLSAHVELELTAQGGHVGFVAANRFGLPSYWLDERIPKYLAYQFRTRGFGIS